MHPRYHSSRGACLAFCRGLFPTKPTSEGIQTCSLLLIELDEIADLITKPIDLFVILRRMQ